LLTNDELGDDIAGKCLSRVSAVLRQHLFDLWRDAGEGWVGSGGSGERCAVCAVGHLGAKLGDLLGGALLGSTGKILRALLRKHLRQALAFLSFALCP
jgi:hypothetical protein